MVMDIASIHNFYEKAVFSTVREQSQHFPHLQDNDDVLADIACVALNRLPPRYIRHDVDLAFFQTEHERTESERAVMEAVEFAYGFVQARNAMRARR
ncbi:late competence development ComFB family protein [Ideonella azotifigens]|nr:late competence development ComFB family protein [Ideonella azotifigens]